MLFGGRWVAPLPISLLQRFLRHTVLEDWQIQQRVDAILSASLLAFVCIPAIMQATGATVWAPRKQSPYTCLRFTLARLGTVF